MLTNQSLICRRGTWTENYTSYQSKLIIGQTVTLVLTKDNEFVSFKTSGRAISDGITCWTGLLCDNLTTIC
jgi:hypothetical protein